MIKLMTDGKTKTINGLKSKSGKKFDCALKLSPEFKVVLDLPDQGRRRHSVLPVQNAKERIPCMSMTLNCGVQLATLWYGRRRASTC